MNHIRFPSFFIMIDTTRQTLGGFDDVASSVVSLPTVLAAFAIFLSAMQGVLALESADPCRLSIRKMNILLVLELAEIVTSITSEALSFVEIRAALRTSLQWLDWVAPCLLAAGMIETAVDVYFTMAVVTKSRVGWMPFSASGSSSKTWEVLPFGLTFSLSISLVGWRLRWWWQGDEASRDVGFTAVIEETALTKGVMGFAVGWTLGISGLVLIIILFSDCAEDGPKYLASVPYLWSPDRWLGDQHGDMKVWYRQADGEDIMQQYVAAAVLDGSIEVPETEDQMIRNLECQPLHCGNAIVGRDREHIEDEDRRASKLHKTILIAEHLVVLPLLFVMVVVVVRLHETMSRDTFEAIKQLVDGVIIISFLEIAIGIKNVLWSIRGVSKKERAFRSSDGRLQQLKALCTDHLKHEHSMRLNELKVE